MKEFPLQIHTGLHGKCHLQGIAVDPVRRYFYYSFTTELIKSDFDGNVVGSVRGIVGHLGCIDFNDVDGKVYGSLEFKHDGIGQGILKSLALDTLPEEGFYVAIFDVSKIDRMNMDAETDGVMTAAFLKEATEDYIGNANGRKHRFGCSGIDGLAVGPEFGKRNGAQYLNIAYGIYGETDRTDNDYQVILQYEIDAVVRSARPLRQANMHRSGPEVYRGKYFVYTGNTTYGVQNLEYDSATGDWYMAVYCGKKETFPNFPMFVIDGTIPPSEQLLIGFSDESHGHVLSLKKAGAFHPESGVYGWQFPLGSTGIASLGDGRFYISEPGTEDGQCFGVLRLYRWTGIAGHPFVLETKD